MARAALRQIVWVLPNAVGVFQVQQCYWNYCVCCLLEISGALPEAGVARVYKSDL